MGDKPFSTASTALGDLAEMFNDFSGDVPQLVSGQGRSVDAINRSLSALRDWYSNMSIAYDDARTISDVQSSADDVFASPNVNADDLRFARAELASTCMTPEAREDAEDRLREMELRFEAKRVEHAGESKENAKSFNQIDAPSINTGKDWVYTPLAYGGMEQQSDCVPYEPEQSSTPNSSTPNSGAQNSGTHSSGSSSSSVSDSAVGTGLTTSGTAVAGGPSLGAVPPTMSPMSPSAFGGGSTSAPQVSLPPSWTTPNAYSGVRGPTPTSSAGISDPVERARRRAQEQRDADRQKMEDLLRGASAGAVITPSVPDRGVSVDNVKTNADTSGRGGATSLTGSSTNAQNPNNLNPNGGPRGPVGGGVMGGAPLGSGANSGSNVKPRDNTPSAFQDPNLLGFKGSVDQSVNGGIVGSHSAEKPDFDTWSGSFSPLDDPKKKGEDK